MRIVFAAFGSRGDTQPYIAFAVELVRAGHEVRLCIAPDYLSLVPTVAGLSVIGTQNTLAANMEKMVPHIATGNAGAAMKAMFELQVEHFAQEADALKAMCAGWAEFLICNGPGCHFAYAVTEALQIKALLVNVQPTLPTRELFPFSGQKLPKFMHMFCWRLISKLIVPAALKRVIAEWKAANGCKPGQAVDSWDRIYRFDTPQILGFSPTSFAPPADWDSQGFDYSITGDWVLSADDLPEKPDAALVQFIEAGKEPPLYIGWGSMAHETGQYMIELAVRALHAVGKRGIVFEGSSGSELFRLSLDKLDPSKPDAAEVAAWAAENVLVTGGVSHEWLFPKVAAVVHHGGAGTSAACFRAGVPSLVTPFGFDQFEFARLTIKHGLGPGPLPPFKAISPKQLGAALVAAVNEPRFKAAAAALRDQMHRERGTKLAVKAFEKMSHRHIWKEDAERQKRGVTHALTPPSIVNWDLVLICGVLFALAVYMLSAWLLEDTPPVAAPIACSWDWRTLGCPPGCKMLLPGACKRV